MLPQQRCAARRKLSHANVLSGRLFIGNRPLDPGHAVAVARDFLRILRRMLGPVSVTGLPSGVDAKHDVARMVQGALNATLSRKRMSE